MGFKRPFDDDEFLGLPFKHSRQLDYSNKTTQFDEVVPLPSVLQKPAVAVENEWNLCTSQGGESSDDDTFGEGVGRGAACTWVSKSSFEDHTSQSSLPERCFELDIPPRVFAPVGDMYTFLLDHLPRKQVPLGPDHQADIPEWEGDGTDEKLDGSVMLTQTLIGERSDGEKLTGTCVIPLSTPLQEDVKVGEGGKQCICPDRGSVRCVRHHIKEAREELIKMLGYDKFKNLGFCDMGEEVSRDWSGEDEQLFHEVVYSNPVSMGLNFWKHLAVAFPSRTKNEIVRYYFNVFVLRRRATQNRTRMLDIDSDDDDWHSGYGSSFGIQYFEEDEENSAVEYPIHQETERDYRLHEEDEDFESDSENEVDIDAGHVIISSDDCKNNSKVQSLDMISRSTGDGLNVEDDSCTSFEHPHNVEDSHGNTNNETGFEDNQKPVNGCDDPVRQGYLFESCDAKVWDARFSNVLKNSTDLLPTRSIIEEIFGNRSEGATSKGHNLQNPKLGFGG